jgi:hypothetical protein
MNPKQISIFLEDRQGKLYKVLSLLKDNNVEVLALNIAEGDGFGILRIVVSDIDKALKVLHENQFVLHLTDVIVAEIKRGYQGFLSVLQALTDNGVNIKYVYGFIPQKRADLFIFRVDYYSKAATALEKNKIHFLSQQQLSLNNFSANQ